MRNTIKLLKIVFDFLDKCGEADLSALNKGKAKLKIEYSKERSVRQKPDANISDIIRKLNTFSTVEDAKNFFIENDFSKATLKEIAERNKTVLMSKDTNEQIINKIIEMMIGSKLRFDALLNMDTK